MNESKTAGKSGTLQIFIDPIEIRQVVVAEGAQYHDTYIPFLKKKLTGFTAAADNLSGEYTNLKQQVTYKIKIVRSKTALKNALETEGIIVIYDGHSRYGRGACLDPDNINSGDQWEDGNDNDDGIFRLGYPLVAVDIEDIETHKYHFAPWPKEDGLPPSDSSDPYTRHPDARRTLSAKLLPEELRSLVMPGHVSDSHYYWGFGSGAKANLILKAGWNATRNAPFDLGSIDLKCKTFCHFGCSSQIHYWKIIRTSDYKGWARPKPPTERFAYFTTNLSDMNTIYWLYNLLRCPLPNTTTSHWFDTHEWAKSQTKIALKSKGASFTIY